MIILMLYAGVDTLFERILEIHDRFHIDVLIPTLDAELAAYQKIEPRLRNLGIKLFLPTEKQLQTRSKANLPELVKMLGFNMPRQKIADTFPDLANLFANEFVKPAVIKGLYYEAGIAYDIYEAERIAIKISHKWGWPLIIQEKIVGEEYDLVLFGDGEGEMVGSVAMKKMALTDKGKAFGGMTITDDIIFELGKAFIKETKWRGPLELEFVKETKSEKYFLIEVNPRFPAWVYFATACGQNLPWAYVKFAIGDNLKPYDKVKPGSFFVRHAVDIVSDISKLEKLSVQGELL